MRPFAQTVDGRPSLQIRAIRVALPYLEITFPTGTAHLRCRDDVPIMRVLVDGHVWILPRAVFVVGVHPEEWDAGFLDLKSVVVPFATGDGVLFCCWWCHFS